MRHELGIVAAACAIALGAHGARGESRPIAWRSEAPVVDGTQVVPMDRDAVICAIREAAVSGRRVVVTVAGPADDEVRGALANAGVALVSPLGGDSFVARMDPARAARSAEGAAGLVVRIEQLTPARRMHPALIAGDIPDHAVVARDPDGGRTVALSVVFHADATAQEMDAAIAAAGGIEISRARALPVSTIEVSELAIAGLASSDAVLWIEPVLPGLTECNAGCRALTQVDTVFGAPYSLTGAGVGVMVYDAGRVLSTHVDFQGRVTTHDATAVNDHSTHVAGTIGGAGIASAANRGIAPGVTIRSFGFEYNGTGTFLATNPGDLESNYQQAFSTLGCVVANTSLGTNVEVNGFACSLQGDYTTTDALLDAIIRGSLGVVVRAAWAAGNERQGNRCDTEGFGDYYSIAPPACSKNAIVVGAVNSDTDQVTSFSSWGPTDDGRVKPDVVAPGCQVGGDGGVTSTSSASNTAYAVKCGTSMATPVTTGVIALMLQDFKARNPGVVLPSNAAYKAMLIQTAKDIGAVGPDYTSGYGSIRAKDAIDLQRSARWVEGSVAQSGERVYLMDVADATAKVRITIAWDDAPGTPGITNTLVNDLDLVVTDPAGVRRYPWTLSNATPSAAAGRTKEDHKNNVEQVVVDTPIAGIWTIVVRGTTVPSGGSQGFALATSHVMVETGLDMAWVTAPPAMAMPGEGGAFTVRASVSAIGETIVPGSVRVRTRAVGGSAWNESMMADQGGGVFAATVSGPACDTPMELEVVASGTETGDHFLPATGPAVIGAGQESVVLATTCEADDGWMVNFGSADTATAGVWGRMDPEATAAQPGDDSPDTGAMCWVTDGHAGASVGALDVDGGMTSLTSPVVDLAGAQSARLTLWGWFSNTAGADPGTDVMRIMASSNNGGAWTTIDTIGPTGADADGGWFTRDIELAGLIAMTGTVRIRFEASDVGLGSVVEAAVDDIRITGWWCEETQTPVPCAGDVNGDGKVNVADFNLLATNFGMIAGASMSQGDVTADGMVNVADFNVVAANFGKVCP